MASSQLRAFPPCAGVWAGSNTRGARLSYAPALRPTRITLLTYVLFSRARGVRWQVCSIEGIRNRRTSFFAVAGSEITKRLGTPCYRHFKGFSTTLRPQHREGQRQSSIPDCSLLGWRPLQSATTEFEGQLRIQGYRACSDYKHPTIPCHHCTLLFIVLFLLRWFLTFIPCNETTASWPHSYAYLSPRQEYSKPSLYGFYLKDTFSPRVFRCRRVSFYFVSHSCHVRGDSSPRVDENRTHSRLMGEVTPNLEWKTEMRWSRGVSAVCVYALCTCAWSCERLNVNLFWGCCIYYWDLPFEFSPSRRNAMKKGTKENELLYLDDLSETLPYTVHFLSIHSHHAWILRTLF